jgi:tRNA modification GTPase
LFDRHRDTIFAIASGAGKAAIAIVRVSGPCCASALESLGTNVRFPAGRVVLRHLRDPRTLETIDRALVTRFAAPRSFTGEDVVEISVTGGRAVVAALLRALSNVEGLRPAEPGEFAWRAFVNGKIDLSEVEGLADLVEAETEAQRKQALQIAGGALRRECEALRAPLLEAICALEAQIDFSDVEDAERLSLVVGEIGRTIIERIDRALAQGPEAGRLREGFVVVIAGPPNVGKSTLMNALAGRDVAITSPLAGTTRDLIEVFLDLQGFPVILIDTAGIRESNDPVEREGVRRALQRLANADLTLWLDDEEGRRAPAMVGNFLAVRTKIDRQRNFHSGPVQAVSAVTGAGVEALLERIGNLARDRLTPEVSSILTLERHRIAFSDARIAMANALDVGVNEPELMAEELRQAARALDRVVGRIGVEEILEKIFARLCVGK